MTEFRTVKATEVRIIPDDEADGKHRAWMRVLTYNVLDDYKTEWAPGVFNDSLGQRMPRLAYGHNGSSDLKALVGRGIDWKEALPEGRATGDPVALDILFEMDDFDDVPSARQFWSQMRSGTIDEFSVGFGRQQDQPSERFKDTPNAKRITKGWLQEVSGVMSGAVPGTKLLSMSRGKPKVVDDHKVNDVLSRMALGELDLADALIEVRSAAVEPRHSDMPGDPMDDGDRPIGCMVDLDDLAAVASGIALLSEAIKAGDDTLPALVGALVEAFADLIHDDDDNGPDAPPISPTIEQLSAKLTQRAAPLPADAFAADGKFPHHAADGSVVKGKLGEMKGKIMGSDLPEASKDKAAAHIQHHMDDPAWSHAFARASAPAPARTRDEAAERSASSEADQALAQLFNR